MSKKLSICIPTYNRAGFLVALLDSVVAATSADNRALVEVCISDNASTDDTEARVRDYAAGSPIAIRYQRNERNLGADQNYLNVVARAGGDYCWLMGSDDIFAPGQVDQVLALTARGHGILLLDRVVCNKEMVPHHAQHWLPGQATDRYFDFRNRAECLEYLRLADSIGALFSFLSSIVVARAEWNATRFDPEYLGTAYSHVYILLQVALRSGIFYVPSLSVLNRSGNDSFLDQGEVNRVLLDYRGYTRLADDLLGADPELRAAFLAVLARERPLPRTSVFLASHASPEQWQKAREYFRIMGVSMAYLAALRLLGPVLRPAYDNLVALYRALRYR